MEPLHDDLNLFNAFREGSHIAFDQLFRKYFVALTYYANQLLHDKNAAEDVVQDSFASLWQRRGRLSAIHSVKAYLYSTVKYQCIRVIQQRDKIKSFETDEYADHESSIETKIIKTEVLRELFEYLATLTPSLQSVLRMYYLEGKSYQEISAILQIDPESVRKQKFRGLRALKTKTK